VTDIAHLSFRSSLEEVHRIGGGKTEFFQHSWGVPFGVRKLACAFPAPEQLHTNKGGSKLWTSHASR